MFLCQLQALAKREILNRDYLAANWNGMLLFQEEVRAVPGAFERKGMALSPTVQQAAPAELTPSNLLAVAEGAYSPASQTYRGDILATRHPSSMVPTPVRLPTFQHPIGKGWGSEPVGTNRKWLGNRVGPLGQTRSMSVPRLQSSTTEKCKECEGLSECERRCLEGASNVTGSRRWRAHAGSKKRAGSVTSEESWLK